MDSHIFENVVVELYNVHLWTDLFEDRCIVIIRKSNDDYICLLKNDENNTFEYFCPSLTRIPTSIEYNINHKYSNYKITNNIHKYQKPEHNTSYKHCILRCFYFLQDIHHDYYHLMFHLSRKSNLSFDDLIEKLVI